jgi:hypothetical protein
VRRSETGLGAGGWEINSIELLERGCLRCWNENFSRLILMWNKRKGEEEAVALKAGVSGGWAGARILILA